MKRATPKRHLEESLPQSQEACCFCEKDLKRTSSLLFVEEEVGRVFCSEACIVSQFSPEIEKLEKEYFSVLQKGELSSDKRSKLAPLRWKTLESAEEVWSQKTLQGDMRYYLISSYEVDRKKVWSICITLMLRGEPSFLYLSLITQLPELVEYYRKGEKVELGKLIHLSKPFKEATQDEVEEFRRLDKKEAFLEESSLGMKVEGRAVKENNARVEITVDEYQDFEECIEDTLESPDEVWNVDAKKDAAEPHLYHFIKQFVEEDDTFWYVIVTRELAQEDQLEILDAFPTRNEELIEQYRKGVQETMSYETVTTEDRVLH
jgi:hypothetical protein